MQGGRRFEKLLKITLAPEDFPAGQRIISCRCYVLTSDLSHHLLSTCAGLCCGAGLRLTDHFLFSFCCENHAYSLSYAYLVGMYVS